MLLILLLVNTLFEGIMGLLLIFKPTWFLRDTRPETVALAQCLGVGALGFAVLSGTMVAGSFTGGIITLAWFHVGVSIMESANLQSKRNSSWLAVLHGIMAILFMVALLKP